MIAFHTVIARGMTSAIGAASSASNKHKQNRVAMYTFKWIWIAANLAAVSVLLSPASAQAQNSPKPLCLGSAGYAAGFEGRQTFLWRPQGLRAALSKIRKNPDSMPAYGALIRSADKALSEGPWTVAAKTQVAPSQDIHDYSSLAPYYWPDPQRPNGPYIRKDGQVNPERNTNVYDRANLEHMASAVRTLGLAYYFTSNKAYADRAALFLRRWFLDPATRMNPNLNFAQAVPGVTAGRGVGVIDGVSFIGVVEAIGLLQPSGSLTETDLKGLRAWFGDFSDWMVSSPIGQSERVAKNNHGLYYDLQLSEYALFSGKADLAKKVMTEFPQRRIVSQFALDGGLPEEQARTRSFHYTMFAMQAFYEVATVGECVGADLWSYKDQQGRGLRQGTDFILGYAGKESSWAWPELSLQPEDLYMSLLEASYGYDDPEIRASAVAYVAKYPDLQQTLISPLLDGR